MRYRNQLELLDPGLVSITEVMGTAGGNGPVILMVVTGLHGLLVIRAQLRHSSINFNQHITSIFPNVKILVKDKI